MSAIALLQERLAGLTNPASIVAGPLPSSPAAAVAMRRAPGEPPLRRFGGSGADRVREWRDHVLFQSRAAVGSDAAAVTALENIRDNLAQITGPSVFTPSRTTGAVVRFVDVVDGPSFHEQDASNRPIYRLMVRVRWEPSS